MTLTERNKIIIEQVNHRLSEMGYAGRLEFDPIPNGFKHRPSYYHKENVCVFTGFLWQMNRLSEDELAADINQRIAAAVSHFGL